MSLLAICRNQRCGQICATVHDGYCWGCSNAGVPDLDGRIAELEAEVERLKEIIKTIKALEKGS